MLGSVETIVAEPSRRRRRYDRQLENIQFWRSIDHFFLRLLRPFWGALVFFFVFVALAVGGCGGFLGASDPGRSSCPRYSRCRERRKPLSSYMGIRFVFPA